MKTYIFLATLPVLILSGLTISYCTKQDSSESEVVDSNIETNEIIDWKNREEEEQKQREEEEEERRKRNHLTQFINQTLWIVAKIKSYNDPIVLEEAAKEISESNLDFEQLQNLESIDLILAIRRFILDMRLNSNERVRLAEATADEEASLVWDCVPSPSAIIATDLLSTGINLAHSTVGGIAAYHRKSKEIQRKAKIKDGKLDDDKLKHLEELEAELIRGLHELFTQNGLKEGSRISSDQSLAFIDRMKDENIESKLEFMNSPDYQKIYQHIPEYWMHKGLCEMSLGRNNEALFSFQKFQDPEIFTTWRKKDRCSSIVAANSINLLIDRYLNQSQKNESDKMVHTIAEIKKQCEILLNYSNESDLMESWKDRYIVATAYNVIGEKEKAFNILYTLIGGLNNSSVLKEKATIETMNKYDPEHGYEKSIEENFQVSLGNVLAICTGLLEEIEKDCINSNTQARLQKLLLDNNTAIQIKLYKIGRIPPNEQERIFTESFKEIKLKADKTFILRGTDYLYLTFPVRWMRFGVPDINIYVDNQGEKQKLEENVKKRTYDSDKGTFTLAFYVESSSSVKVGKPIKIVMEHKALPISLVFDANGSGNEAKLVSYRYNIGKTARGTGGSDEREFKEVNIK